MSDSSSSIVSSAVAGFTCSSRSSNDHHAATMGPQLSSYTSSTVSSANSTSSSTSSGEPSEKECNSFEDISPLTNRSSQSGSPSDRRQNNNLSTSQPDLHFTISNNHINSVLSSSPLPSAPLVETANSITSSSTQSKQNFSNSPNPKSSRTSHPYCSIHNFSPDNSPPLQYRHKSHHHSYKTNTDSDSSPSHLRNSNSPHHFDRTSKYKLRQSSSLQNYRTYRATQRGYNLDISEEHISNSHYRENSRDSHVLESNSIHRPSLKDVPCDEICHHNSFNGIDTVETGPHMSFKRHKARSTNPPNIYKEEEKERTNVEKEPLKWDKQGSQIHNERSRDNKEIKHNNIQYEKEKLRKEEKIQKDKLITDLNTSKANKNAKNGSYSNSTVPHSIKLEQVRFKREDLDNITINNIELTDEEKGKTKGKIVESTETMTKLNPQTHDTIAPVNTLSEDQIISSSDEEEIEALLTPEDELLLTPNHQLTDQHLQRSNSLPTQNTSYHTPVEDEDKWGSPSLTSTNIANSESIPPLEREGLVETRTRDETSLTSVPQITVSRCHNALLFGCSSVDSFKKLNKISEGTYGTVFRASNSQTGEIVALKHIKYHEKLWEEGFPITSLREISILLELDHPNIVLVKEVVVGSSPHQVYMVMEYVEHELKALLDTNKPEFSVSERKCLLQQLLRAIDYLHKNWVIHRDLKTSNLLYTNKGHLKLCDFGMARKFGDPIKPYTHNVVTLWYRAPELILGQKLYTKAVDLWSAGCIFAEMILRKPIFPGQGEEATLKRIFKLCGYPSEENWPGFNALPAIKNQIFPRFSNYKPSWREIFPFHSNYYSSVSGSLSEAGLDLLQKLLEICPEKRISAEQALQHPYFLTEKPHPQPVSMMPTVPDTNSQTRRKKPRDKSIDLEEMKLQEAFHDASFRFGGRVDAEQFLSQLDKQKPTSTSTQTHKQRKY